MGKLNLRIFNKDGAEIVHQYNKEKQYEVGNLYMKQVSCGLFETDTLIIFNEDVNGILYPIEEVLRNFRLNETELDSQKEVLGEIDKQTGESGKELKLLLFIDTENQTDLRFFNVKNNEIVWTNKVLVGSASIEDVGVHLAFMGEKEGVYENTMYLCEVHTSAVNPDDIAEDDDIEIIGAINIQSTAIGEDERYRNLFTNFGIPDPKKYLDIFKDTDEDSTDELYHKYDDNIDYEFLNKKSKKLFLSYPEIFPYVGTYKALINAVKYLGYDDIYFKEWYKELPTITGKAAKNVTYEVAYKSKNSMLTKLPLDRRVSLKKLNWLSMVYKIAEFATDENGEQLYEYLPDNVQIPLLKNNYNKYEASEILIKLFGLKEWLEKNIIALNCRIIEINGEGIVVERYKHRIYGKTTVGSLYRREKSLTPFVANTPNELLLADSSCKIKLGLQEQFSDDDFANNYKSITFRANLTSKNGALPKKLARGYDPSTGQNSVYGLVDNMAIIVKDGEIFFDSKDVNSNGLAEAVFMKMPTIQIERANLRNPNKAWNKSIEYVIDRKGPAETPYRFIRNKISVDDDNILYSKEYIALRPLDNPSLKYTTQNIFGVPLFMLKNFNDETIITGTEKDIFVGNEYILEILDGKFIFNNDDINIPSGENYADKTTKMISLNFNFDSDSNEQTVELNYTYTKNVSAQEIAKGRTSDYLTEMTVNNIGEYTITAIATDECNNFFANNIINPVVVTVPNPTLKIYSNNSYSNNEEDFYKINADGVKVEEYKKPSYTGKTRKDIEKTYSNNSTCLLPETYLSNDVEVLDSSNGGKIIKYVTYPTISYAIDTPKSGDIAHFMNISDKFEYVEIITKEMEPDRYKSGYVCVRFKRNDVFSANTLNTGDIDSSVDDFEPLQLSNIVIYDKLHNQIIYQARINLYFDKVDASTEATYVYTYFDNDALRYIYLYYKDAPTDALQNVLLNSNPQEENKYIYIQSPEEYTSEGSNVNIIKILNSAKQIMDFYILPAYELPITIDSSSRNIIRIKNGYYPNSKTVFNKKDIVKVVFAYTVGAHTYRACGTYKVLDISNNEITLDKEISPINPKLLKDNSKYSLCVSHANCAYVDYNLIVDYAKEIYNGYTNLYVKDDYFLNFIDNTYSITTKPYKKSNGHLFWMQDTSQNKITKPTIITNGDIYGYDIPITVNQENPNVVFYPSCEYSIDGNPDMISSFFTGKDENNSTYIHTYWKVYKCDKYKNENALIFESWNEVLYLNIVETGVYSIDLCMFDNYGNETKKYFGEIIKVI